VHLLEEHSLSLTKLRLYASYRRAGFTVNLHELTAGAGALSEDLRTIRRDLHRNPEFGLDLPQTLARVIDEVAGLGEIFTGEGMTAAALLIKGSKPGPTVLLRADMDALAVIEDTGLDFASTNGYMHACGHDLHIAMGIGAARLLHQHREELKGDVVIWFQPGEEGLAGADRMLEQKMHLVSGSKPIAAYGVHVFSVYPKGMFGARPGPLMAAAGGFKATFKGAGGHGSMPWLSKDPISPMAQSIATLQAVINKRLDVFDDVVVNVGWVKAGDDHTENVIPETASFGATVRTFSEVHSKLIREVVADVLEGQAKAFGVEVAIEWMPASKVLINDADAVLRSRKVISELFGEGRYWDMPNPIPGGEDFASVLEEIPGAFIFMGAAPEGVDPRTAPSNHSNKALFDDDVLPLGAAFLAAMAIDTLNN
jgi:amidohydrolase